MKKLFFILCAFIGILLTACNTFAPDMCTIVVKDCENGTVTVDKEQAFFGEVVTATITPDAKYKFANNYGFLPSGVQTVNLYNDPLIVSFVANQKNIVVNPEFEKANRYKITTTASSHGTFTVDPNAYEQSIVDVTVNPDKYYHVKADGLIISDITTKYYGYSDATDATKWHFRMPSHDSTVSVTFQSDIYFTQEEESVQKGEKLVYKVVNTTGDSKFDIYVNGKLFESNVDLSGGKYELDTSKLDEGMIEVYAKNANVQSDSITSKISFANLPNGWDEVGLTFVKKQEYSSYSNNKHLNSYTYKVDTEAYKSDKLKYFYYFESNPTDIKTGNIGYYDTDFTITKIEDSYDYAEEYLVVYIDDSDNMVKSGKCYYKLPYCTQIEKETNYSIEIDPLDVKNMTVEIAPEDKDYFIVEEYTTSDLLYDYTITSKKPTNKPRRIYFKDADGNRRAYWEITISGNGAITELKSREYTLQRNEYYYTSTNYDEGKWYSSSNSYQETLYLLNFDNSNYSTKFNIDNATLKVKDPSGTVIELETQTVSIKDGYFTFKPKNNSNYSTKGEYSVYLEVDGLISSTFTIDKQ